MRRLYPRRHSDPSSISTKRDTCGHDTPVTNSTAEETYAALLSLSGEASPDLRLPMVTPEQPRILSSGSLPHETRQDPGSFQLISAQKATRLFTASSSCASSQVSSSCSPLHPPAIASSLHDDPASQIDNDIDESPEISYFDSPERPLSPLTTESRGHTRIESIGLTGSWELLLDDKEGEEQLYHGSEHIVEFDYESCLSPAAYPASEYEEITVYSDEQQHEVSLDEDSSTLVSSVAPSESQFRLVLETDNVGSGQPVEDEEDGVGSLPSLFLEDLNLDLSETRSEGQEETSSYCSDEDSLALPTLQKNLSEVDDSKLEYHGHFGARVDQDDDCSQTLSTSHTSFPEGREKDDVVLQSPALKLEESNEPEQIQQDAVSTSLMTHASDPSVEIPGSLQSTTASFLSQDESDLDVLPDFPSALQNLSQLSPIREKSPSRPSLGKKTTVSPALSIDDQVKESTKQFDALRRLASRGGCNWIGRPPLVVNETEKTNQQKDHTKDRKDPTVSSLCQKENQCPKRRQPPPPPPAHVDVNTSVESNVLSSPRSMPTSSPLATKRKSYYTPLSPTPLTPQTGDEKDSKFSFTNFRTGLTHAKRRGPLSPSPVSPASLKDRDEEAKLPTAQHVRNNVPTQHQVEHYPIVSLTFLANPLTPATAERVVKQSWEILQPGGTMYVCHVIQRREDKHADQSFSSTAADAKNELGLLGAVKPSSSLDAEELVPSENTLASLEPHIPAHIKDYLRPVSVGGVKQRKYEIQTLEILQRGGHTGPTFNNQHDLIQRWVGVKPKSTPQ